jgi:hypothetical protein
MSACIPADRLVQTLTVQVPGVTADMLNLQLFNVIDEFFRKSNAWRYDVEIDMKEGYLDYGFAVPNDTMVVRELNVTHNGMPVANTQSGAVQSSVGRIDSSELFPDGDVAIDPAVSDLAGNNLFTWAIYRPEYVTLTGTPDAEGRQYPLKMTLALTVKHGCLECDCGDWPLEEWQWDTYFQVFLDGTLWKLYGIPAKPWSNPTMAAYHGKRFRGATAFHKQEAKRGFTFATQTWRFPRGGWT